MNSARRKLAIATWSAPREGNIYGKLTVDATELVKFIAKKREETGHRVTVTHVVGLAVARALAASPGLNGYITPFGSYRQHTDVDITYLVALEEGKNLAKATIRKADRMGVVELAADLKAQADRLRAGKDEAFNKSQAPLAWIPMFLLKRIVWLTGFLASAVGISVPLLGVEKFAFGSAIVTSVGMFGLDEGFAPPTPFARVPCLVLVGAMGDRPTVVDGEVVIRTQLTLTATLDHRFVDGAQGGVLAKVVRELLENPWALDEA